MRLLDLTETLVWRPERYNLFPSLSFSFAATHHGCKRSSGFYDTYRIKIIRIVFWRRHSLVYVNVITVVQKTFSSREPITSKVVRLSFFLSKQKSTLLMVLNLRGISSAKPSAGCSCQQGHQFTRTSVNRKPSKTRGFAPLTWYTVYTWKTIHT